VVLGCTVLKVCLLPVMLLTVRPRVLKCEGKMCLDEYHKKNSWPKGKRRKTRCFTVSTLSLNTRFDDCSRCHNNWSLWLNATLPDSNYVRSVDRQMTILPAHLC
jgi:hypothetical protein